jgi:hypothetical protein
VPGKARVVGENQQQPEELTPEELEELQAEELPQREAMSLLRVPFLGAGPPLEATEDLPDE